MEKRGWLRGLLLLVSCAIVPFVADAQKVGEFSSPFDFRLLLSGNFGELRSNHFHAGVDFKTQGVVGKPIKCVADGYICRAKVQSGGYGCALYVMHDNGYMTVYGHLDRFPDIVAERIREKQYKDETFEVDLEFLPSEFRVLRGEVLAYAGNTGYSFGPHLHFEVRDSTGNELYDPMLFYREVLSDTRPPRAMAIAVYPCRGKGVVEGGDASKVYKVNGQAVPDTIVAWGSVGFGVKALDYMDDTHNKYGVYRLELFVDGVELFRSEFSNFSFDENRLINAWVDYERYINGGEWFQKLFVPGSNPLRVLTTAPGKGWLDVDEERFYNVECRMSDYHGNSSACRVVVKGERAAVNDTSVFTHVMYREAVNSIEFMGMRLFVPKGELFEDAFLNVRLVEKGALSGRYDLGGTSYPLWHGGTLSLRVDDAGGVDPSRLYMRRITRKGSVPLVGEYSGGWLTAKVNILGCYEVAVDTVPPRVKPVKEGYWMRNSRIVFAVADGETSIKSFRGTIDGNFVLFEYSSKNSRLTLDLKKENVGRGNHVLKVEVTDACGNVSVFEKNFEY